MKALKLIWFLRIMDLFLQNTEIKGNTTKVLLLSLKKIVLKGNGKKR